MDRSILDTLKKGFPQNLIKKRKGLGGSYDFVTGNSVQDRLDEVFNGDWSWQVDPEFGYKIGKDWVYVVGILTIYPGNGEIIRKSGEGAVQIKKSHQGNILDLGFDISAASTKALKKAATRLGIAREIEVAEPDDEGSAPTSTEQKRVVVSKPKPAAVFSGNDFPTSTSTPVESSTNDDVKATPVQVEYIKTKVKETSLNVLEVIRKGLGREDVPDQPKDLTREEAKKVLIILNR